jgi:hypothetical protein
VAELTPEEIREALESEEGRLAISEAVREELGALDLGGRVERLVEARLEEERVAFRDESDERARRNAELDQMRAHAHRQIEESKLTDKLKESLRSRFDLVEGMPTLELDLVADVDSEGEVTKSSFDKLTEAVEAQIKWGHEILAEANPTRVRGQGPRELSEAAAGTPGEKDDKDGEPSAEQVLGPRSAQLLREAGIKDPVAARKITPESVLARQGIGG